ncbi:hypothetical protein BDV12DRAFT_146659 [Aspergillus spectabilis]
MAAFWHVRSALHAYYRARPRFNMLRVAQLARPSTAYVKELGTLLILGANIAWTSYINTTSPKNNRHRPNSDLDIPRSRCPEPGRLLKHPRLMRGSFI